MKKILLFVILEVFFFLGKAQQEPLVEDLFKLSLEELMNVTVTVATKSETTIRETPSVITVITREDIARTGARDLIDVFQIMAPGFNFGIDVEGIVGMGFRGIWAYEGKILMMIDGIEINEELFATVQFGNHYPIDNIERIEIIRGPGSAIYGGYAELAVINLITRKIDDGGYVSATVSATDQTYTHRNTAFGINKKKGDFSITINSLAGQGTRSDKNNIDFYENSYPMKDNSELNIFNTNLSLEYKNLKFTTIYDDYETTQIDLWGTNYEYGALKESFRTVMPSLSYDIKTEKHKITLKGQYKYQQPWMIKISELTESYNSTKHTGKTTTEIIDEISISEKSNVVAGYVYTNTAVYRKNADETFINNKNKMSLNNHAIFAQYMQYTDWANLTIGSRFDYNDEYGSSFVPRLGITKAWEKFHGKIMASQSFRFPGGIIPNRLPTGKTSIDPEKATNFEVEMGIKIFPQLYFIINGYKVTVDNVITYQTDPVTGNGVYFNSSDLSTLGTEAELKYIGEAIHVDINYAYYKADKTIDLYSVPGESNQLLGLAPQQINGQLSIKLMKNAWFTTNLSWFGERYGYTHADALDNPVLTKFDPSVLLNANLQFNNFLTKDLSLTIGGHNLSNSDFAFIQPYNGWHAPLPSHSRSLMVRVTYDY